MIGHADQRRNARPRLIPSWSAKAGYPRLCGLPQRKTWMAAMTVSGRGHRELGVGVNQSSLMMTHALPRLSWPGVGRPPTSFGRRRRGRCGWPGHAPAMTVGSMRRYQRALVQGSPGKGSIAAIRPSTHSDWRTARDTQAAAPRPVRFSAPKYWRGSSGRRARNPDWQAAPDVLHPSNAQTTAVARCRCAPNGFTPHSGVHRLHLWGRWCRRDYQREGWHPHRSA